jgi:LPS sulfotransferase NodH
MKYFFVSGAHKSGTSWLASMIRAHPEVEMPNNEMWLFGHPKSLGGKNLQTAIEKWLTIPTVAKQFREQQARHLSPKIARAVVSTILKTYRTPSTKALGDKSPLFSLRGSEEIRKAFPDSHLIVIYRDGRDAAVSHHFHNLRLRDFRKYENKIEGEAAYRHHILGADEAVPLLHRETIEEVSRNWAQSNMYAEAARTQFGERFMATSYEDLWADPVPFLTQVFSALGVRRDQKLIEDIVRSKSFTTVTKGRAPGVMDPQSFYRTGEPGDWRNYFDQKSAALFNELAGEWLLKLGYASSLDWWKEQGAAASGHYEQRQASDGTDVRAEAPPRDDHLVERCP